MARAGCAGHGGGRGGAVRAVDSRHELSTAVVGGGSGVAVAGITCLYSGGIAHRGGEPRCPELSGGRTTDQLGHFGLLATGGAGRILRRPPSSTPLAPFRRLSNAWPVRDRPAVAGSLDHARRLQPNSAGDGLPRRARAAQRWAATRHLFAKGRRAGAALLARRSPRPHHPRRQHGAGRRDSLARPGVSVSASADGVHRAGPRARAGCSSTSQVYTVCRSAGGGSLFLP